MPSAHKGAISFGLVHIPIQLQVAVREHDLSFNQLCKKTGERIRYKKFCPSCNKEIKQDEIVFIWIDWERIESKRRNRWK